MPDENAYFRNYEETIQCNTFDKVKIDLYSCNLKRKVCHR